MAAIPKMTVQQMLALVFGQYDIWTESQFTWTAAAAGEIYRNKSTVPVMVTLCLNIGSVGTLKIRPDNQEGHKWMMNAGSGNFSFILRPGQSIWGITTVPGDEVYVSISSGLPLKES